MGRLGRLWKAIGHFPELPDSSALPPGTRIDSLQAGRAIAALLVVVHHANTASREFGGRSLDLLDYGWAGVDFFFVLSGFIIAYSVSGKSVGEYSWHRFRRVFIPYLPIGIAIAALYALAPNISAGTREWSWLTSLTLIPFDQPALSVAWTLQHEMFFYAIFAVAWFTNSMWVLVVWGILCCFGFNNIPLSQINLEFLAGIACFYAVRAGVWTRWLYLLSAFFLMCWIWTGAQRDTSFLLGFAIAAAIPPIIKMELGGVRIPRFLSFLGAASYSIYLAHNIAISLAVRIYVDLVWCFIFGTVVGIAYYLIVERTILNRISRDRPALTSARKNR